MELDQDGPLTKWKSKNGNRFQLQLALCTVTIDCVDLLAALRSDGGGVVRHTSCVILVYSRDV